MKWIEEVEKRKLELIRDTQNFLRIKSVSDENSSREGAPFGDGIAQALTWILEKGEQEGFISKNLDGFAGHLEMGEGEEIIGILCHIDVVPEGDGWTSDPYRADIRDGRIYARGAIDDKGPTIAAFYAMKIVKELGLPLNKRVRLIIGTDEESNWQCVDHYFKHEPMPVMGFAPDADFPIIFAEKGISDFDFVQTSSQVDEQSQYKLLSFEAGRRYNMVPDLAVATITMETDDNLTEKYKEYLNRVGVEGTVERHEQTLTFTLVGKSAHGMEPNLGTNAALLLNHFLNQLDLNVGAKQYTQFIEHYLYEDSRGRAFGVSFTDEMMGDLTINAGVFSYSEENGGKIGLNLRYPATANYEKIKALLQEKGEAASFRIAGMTNSKPHHVDKDHLLIKTLKRVYEEQMNEEATLLSIGGGTYARSLKAGVAFGALFQGREDVAHQKDEYIAIDDLLRATALYAQAIYELAK